MTGYILIPNEIIRRKDLSDKAKMIYGFIQGWFEDECVASNKYIAGMLGTTERTVKRCIKELMDKKLIRKRLVFKNNQCVGRVLNANNKN